MYGRFLVKECVRSYTRPSLDFIHFGNYSKMLGPLTSMLVYKCMGVFIGWRNLFITLASEEGFFLLYFLWSLSLVSTGFVGGQEDIK